ncbi:MAG: alcohol dehydrogenase catalytic domain-containing protein [Spirochaetales bacterium]|nr:alcohol dehydrogenase catalytic domain-containing protein [Spirochaetales bacterium]
MLKIPEYMKAVVLMGPDKLEVRDMKVPVPGPVDVLIKVESCALCGSDTGLIHKPFPGQPPYGEFIIGHEYSGTVAALGETVDEFAVGDRVTVEAHNGCGRCRNCRLGNYTGCLNYGHPEKGHRANGFTTNGGNAQYVINHINTVHKIADNVSFDEASLATNLGCVLYGFETLGGFIAGDTIVIVGPGPLGLSAVQAARALGAGKIILLGTRDSRLKVAENTGADIIVNTKKQDPMEVIMRETGGKGCDIAIEASGSEAGLGLSIKSTKRMGKVLLLAFPHKPFPADFEDLALNNKHIFTVRGEGWANVGRAAVFLNKGIVDLKPLITHTFPLAKINEAFDTFNNRIDGAIKVITKPQE